MTTLNDKLEDWGDYNEKVTPQFSDYKRESIYITMRDGIKIAADIMLPLEYQKGMKLPTLLYQTRYWRGYDVKGEFRSIMPHSEHEGGAVPRFLISYGYAFVFIDSRGSGASFGHRPIEHSQDEIKDSAEIIDWIIRQTWSNGKVATFGNSNAGSTAEYSMVYAPQALKVVSPRANEFDIYVDIAYPGGILLSGFLDVWGQNNFSMDHNYVDHLGDMGNLIHGVLPVDSDIDKKQLAEAVSHHAANFDFPRFLRSIEFKDDWVLDPAYTFDKISMYAYKSAIEATNIPIFGWGSWMDANTPDVQIRRFLSFSNPQVNVIGCWNHNGRYNGDPLDKPVLNPEAPPKGLSYEQQQLEWIRCFDYYTKNIGDNGWNPTKRLIYYTMGENKWKSTAVWPPKGQVYESLYLYEKNSLSECKSLQSEEYDLYQVNFDSGTGMNSRWFTEMGLPVFYPNRVDEDQKNLVFTSKPLIKDREITGYPLITLYLSTSEHDGAIFAYFELIDPEGFIYYITEGELRFKHRKILDSTQAPYVVPYPYHSFKRENALPVVPGEIIEVTFQLIPTSILVPKGWQIRISLAGHDRDNFQRIPNEGDPILKIYRDLSHPSRIEIPFIKRNEIKDE